MNIDLATLLLGGTQGKPKAGLLSEEGFSQTLDEKLALLAEHFPGMDLQALMAPQEAGLLPPQPTGADLIADGVDAEGEWLTSVPGLAEALKGVTLTEGEGEESPQWQQQQLVTRNVAGAEPGVRTNTGKAADGIPPEKPIVQSGKLAAPMTATDKTPAAAPGVLTAAPAPVASEAVATVEATSAPTVSAVALPAAVRTSVTHAPQQVVTVNHPPETPEWKQSVSQHIAIFSRNGLHSAEIRLHPEELGALQITLRVQQEQAQIHIVSEHAHVRHAMEQAMPQLRAAMAESGIQLGQANVSADAQYGPQDGQGDNPAAEQQAANEGEEQPLNEEIVPTLLTTTPGNIYGINTFA